MALLKLLGGLVSKIIPYKSSTQATSSEVKAEDRPSNTDKAKSGLKKLLDTLTKPLIDKVLKPLAIRFALSDEVVMILALTIIVAVITICFSLIILVLAFKI